MFHYRIYILFIMVAMFSWGCNGNASSTPTSGCKSDQDCTSGWQCVENECTDSPTADAGMPKTDSGIGKTDMGMTDPDLGTDLGTKSQEATSYHTFSVGAGKMKGGGYNAKVRISSTPAGKQTDGSIKHKAGSP